MQFSDFLSLVKVIRMLYGVEIATLYFEKNKGKFDTLFSFDYNEITKSIQSESEK